MPLNQRYYDNLDSQVAELRKAVKRFEKVGQPRVMFDNPHRSIGDAHKDTLRFRAAMFWDDMRWLVIFIVVAVGALALDLLDLWTRLSILRWLGFN